MGTKLNTLLEELPEFIFGAEGEGDAGSDSGDADDSTGNASTDGQENAGSASGSEGDNTDEHDDDDDDQRDTSGLKSALAKERKAAREAIKRANALEREKEERELAEKSEIERERIKAQKAAEKAERLAASYLTEKLENAIRAAATDFIDTDDVINAISRDDLVFEQDADDPSKVNIDKKSVDRAIKALAARKAHWLKAGTEDGGPTGSSFGGGKPKKPDPTEEYKTKYPSLG